MLGDSHGEPSLGALYRIFVSRVARAVQQAGASRLNEQAYHQLDEIRIKLDAWADLVGVKRDVLESVDEDGGLLAATTRDSFLHLLAAMDHVEMKLGLRDEFHVRPDALTHLSILFQISLMDKTGSFDGYVSAARRAASNYANRSSDSPCGPIATSSSRPMSRILQPWHSNVSTPREIEPDFDYRGRFDTESAPPPESTIIKVESPMSEAALLESSEASLSRPSTAGSAYRLATSSSYATSPPPSNYPSISQLLGSSQPHHNATYPTPSTASSSSSPLSPWTPYQSRSSPYSVSPVAVRHVQQTDRWPYSVLNPIYGDDQFHAHQLPAPMEPPRPVEPPMRFYSQPPPAVRPVFFKTEGWLAGDDRKQPSSNPASRRGV